MIELTRRYSNTRRSGLTTPVVPIVGHILHWLTDFMDYLGRYLILVSYLLQVAFNRAALSVATKGYRRTMPLIAIIRRGFKRGTEILPMKVNMYRVYQMLPLETGPRIPTHQTASDADMKMELGLLDEAL
ncbi:hypothetical protein F5Y05DRAFT_61509 [Hypoxylon sp. FL0543]|nr:hypothetical protein F5Y05DRAFT_61509 [Hypoxylon sp. FL0543]